MELEVEADKILLPHHTQQALYTTRSTYRQGRNLTAVKVYTVSNESRHLLVFGDPSLNLRLEAKALFSKFGKLLRFNMSGRHECEIFTETYHATYQRVQCARVAKRMCDTKSFYDCTLHVCYAPEMESVEEVREKLLQRKRDVFWRLKNLEREKEDLECDNAKKSAQKTVTLENNLCNNDKLSKGKLNMGEFNTISVGKQIRDVVFVNCLKRKTKKIANHLVIEKKFEPCFLDKTKSDEAIEVIDCTSTEKSTVTNINESLNYSSFGTKDETKVSNIKEAISIFEGFLDEFDSQHLSRENNPYLSVGVVRTCLRLAEERGLHVDQQKTFIEAYSKVNGEYKRLRTVPEKEDGNTWDIVRNTALKQLKEKYEESKLFNDKDEPTDDHLQLLLWAYSPEPATVKKLITETKEEKREESRKRRSSVAEDESPSKKKKD